MEITSHHSNKSFQACSQTTEFFKRLHRYFHFVTGKYRHQNIHPQTAVLTIRYSRMYHKHITGKEMSYLKVGVSIYNYQPSFTVLFRLLFLFSRPSFRLSRRINACAICPINSSIAPLDGAHNRIRCLSARGPYEELD